MHDKSKISFADISESLAKENLLIRKVNESGIAEYVKLETDSRKISAGDVFICIKGYENDGHLFAHLALENGAELFIVQHVLPFNKPQIVVTDTRRAAAVLARLFFDDPTAKFKLIGITGTNGKTTISKITETLLLMNGIQTGMIGTLGYSINGQRFISDRTTPDIIDLHRIFSKMVESGIEIVIMEVSSHALRLDRVYGLHFAVGFFSNLTQDHLDFHIDLDDYAESKFLLFEYIQKNKGISILNIDDPYGKMFYEKIPEKKISISTNHSDYQFAVLEQSSKGSRFTLNNSDFFTNLIGNYNIFNVAAAISIIRNAAPQIDIAKIKNSLKFIQPVQGRLQRVDRFRDFSVYVDYAHSPDALFNVLGSLNGLPHNRLLCVFGAGGNRDRSKRSKMLEAVLSFADFCIITNDNPRNEEPEEIIRDLIEGFAFTEKFWIIRNRQKAIETIIKSAQPGDLVLIAGKGHETYQEIKGTRFYFDDVEIASATAEIQDDDQELAFPIDPLLLKFLYQISNLAAEDQLLTNISTDSRTIKDSSLFFALQGENFDGHDFVEKILQNETCWAVVKQDYPLEHDHLLRVDDTLQAYGRLAEKYRRNFDLKMIAITGSIGKTTTKEYLTNILSQTAQTIKTEGNENNLIGLPKTIFNFRSNHDYAVLELGTNQIGEISRLAGIAYPNYGIITNVGPSHLEFLKTEENVFIEKTALFAVEGISRFFPAGDARFAGFEGITFGREPNAIYQLYNVRKKGEATVFLINEFKFSIPTPYQKFVDNALIAIAVCLELGTPSSVIQSGLQMPLQIAHRMEIRTSQNRCLLLDCYNANPSSMQAAIDFWISYHTDKPHVAILGDMLELGEYAEHYHLQIASRLSTKQYEKLISVGDRSILYKADFHYENVEKLIKSKKLDEIPSEAVVLLKASRGIHLEKLIERL